MGRTQTQSELARQRTLRDRLQERDGSRQLRQPPQGTADRNGDETRTLVFVVFDSAFPGGHEAELLEEPSNSWRPLLDATRLEVVVVFGISPLFGVVHGQLEIIEAPVMKPLTIKRVREKLPTPTTTPANQLSGDKFHTASAAAPSSREIPMKRNDWHHVSSDEFHSTSSSVSAAITWYWSIKRAFATKFEDSSWSNVSRISGPTPDGYSLTEVTTIATKLAIVKESNAAVTNATVAAVRSPTTSVPAMLNAEITSPIRSIDVRSTPDALVSIFSMLSHSELYSCRASSSSISARETFDVAWACRARVDCSVWSCEPCRRHRGGGSEPLLILVQFTREIGPTAVCDPECRTITDFFEVKTPIIRETIEPFPDAAVRETKRISKLFSRKEGVVSLLKFAEDFLIRDSVLPTSHQPARKPHTVKYHMINSNVSVTSVRSGISYSNRTKCHAFACYSNDCFRVHWTSENERGGVTAPTRKWSYPTTMITKGRQGENSSPSADCIGHQVNDNFVLTSAESAGAWISTRDTIDLEAAE